MVALKKNGHSNISAWHAAFQSFLTLFFSPWPGHPWDYVDKAGRAEALRLPRLVTLHPWLIRGMVHRPQDTVIKRPYHAKRPQKDRERCLRSPVYSRVFPAQACSTWTYKWTLYDPSPHLWAVPDDRKWSKEDSCHRTLHESQIHAQNKHYHHFKTSSFRMVCYTALDKQTRNRMSISSNKYY